tara:strand:+ start:13270 stop:15708 length:2439 start_codon:yes stop_codon:yes gene_type:complete
MNKTNAVIAGSILSLNTLGATAASFGADPLAHPIVENDHTPLFARQIGNTVEVNWSWRIGDEYIEKIRNYSNLIIDLTDNETYQNKWSRAWMTAHAGSNSTWTFAKLELEYDEGVRYAEAKMLESYLAAMGLQVNIIRGDYVRREANRFPPETVIEHYNDTSKNAAIFVSGAILFRTERLPESIAQELRVIHQRVYAEKSPPTFDRGQIGFKGSLDFRLDDLDHYLKNRTKADPTYVRQRLNHAVATASAIIPDALETGNQELSRMARLGIIRLSPLQQDAVIQSERDREQKWIQAEISKAFRVDSGGNVHIDPSKLSDKTKDKMEVAALEIAELTERWIKKKVQVNTEKSAYSAASDAMKERHPEFNVETDSGDLYDNGVVGTALQIIKGIVNPSLFAKIKTSLDIFINSEVPTDEYEAYTIARYRLENSLKQQAEMRWAIQEAHDQYIDEYVRPIQKTPPSTNGSNDGQGSSGNGQGDDSSGGGDSDPGSRLGDIRGGDDFGSTGGGDDAPEPMVMPPMDIDGVFDRDRDRAKETDKGNTMSSPPLAFLSKASEVVGSTSDLSPSPDTIVDDLQEKLADLCFRALGVQGNINKNALEFVDFNSVHTPTPPKTWDEYMNNESKPLYRTGILNDSSTRIRLRINFAYLTEQQRQQFLNHSAQVFSGSRIKMKDGPVLTSGRRRTFTYSMPSMSYLASYYFEKATPDDTLMQVLYRQDFSDEVARRIQSLVPDISTARDTLSTDIVQASDVTSNTYRVTINTDILSTKTRKIISEAAKKIRKSPDKHVVDSVIQNMNNALLYSDKAKTLQPQR